MMAKKTNSDKDFEILPHTADMRMRVRGKTLEELFKNALKGMAYCLKPDIFSGKKAVSGGAAVKSEINIDAVDINSLLVEFLSEIIAQTDINNAVFVSAVFRNFGENFLSGEISGVKVGGFARDIKAVSYHEVDIAKNRQNGFYEATLVFDV